MKNICNLCRKEIDSKLYTCESCFNLIKNKLNIKIAYNYKDKVYTITSTTRKIDEYRDNMKTEAFNLINKYFWHLWD